MKRHTSLLLLGIFLGILLAFVAFFNAAETQAQIDAFTFFIPFDTDAQNDLFDLASDEEATIVNSGTSTCGEMPNIPLGQPGQSISDGNMVTTISIAVLRAGTVIYYDHWEDGLETNLTSPTQSSTQVWGDGNPANGSLPPTIPPNTTGTDTLVTGQVIVLENIVTVPRDPANFFFDGGDKITTLGGSIAATLAAWPECSSTLFAGAWELYPTSRLGKRYTMPVGENLGSPLPPLPPPPNTRVGFRVVRLNVQATQNNTTVEFDLNGDDIFGDIANVTLSQGENYSPASGVQSGAQISATKLVQVHLMTGDSERDPNAYEGRAYSMVPRSQWTNDYIAPRSSNGDFWLYNPDRTTALNVTISTTVAPPANIPIPPNTTVRYSTGGGPMGLSQATGIRFTAPDGRSFYGLVALDPSFAREWAYSLQPIANLTTQTLIGWGPVNNLKPPNNTPPPATGRESPVYVTAQTTTTLFIDFNNGGPVLTRTITPLAEVAITDTVDFDMTGAFLYTTDGTPFISVWGQTGNVSDASPVNPSIDVGTNIVPIASLAVQKKMDVIIDADGSQTPTWGDTVRFTLFTYNNSNIKLNQATISDTLTSSLSYIASSSQVRGVAITDDSIGNTIFPFDEGGHAIAGGLNPQEVVTSTFEAIINQNVDVITNTILADSPETKPTDPGGIDVPLFVPAFELDKFLIDPANGVAQKGNVITFGLRITSTGNISITKMPLNDVHDESHLTFLYSTPTHNITSSGVVTWFDLATTTVFGPLLPGRTINLTLTFQVDNIPDTVAITTNTAVISGAKAGDIPLPPQDDDEDVEFPTPTTTRTPTPTPTNTPTPTPLVSVTPTNTPTPTPTPNSPQPPDGNDDDDGDPPTPTPTPYSNPPNNPPSDDPRSPTVVPNSPPGGAIPTSPVFPVSLLPETGVTAPKAGWSFVILMVLTVIILWAVRRNEE